jgi:3-oxoacyl-[acyl-carrier protein] reductase
VRAPLAVVSGGTRGIGLALSRRLAKLGHHVVALYHSDSAAAEASGLDARRVDVADALAVASVCESLVDAYGPPRVLVNNAGLNIDKPFLSMSTSDWDRVVGTNLSGVFHLCRALAPSMLASGGVIVNVGATTGIRPRLNGANYCASKAGLLQLTKCLALELAPRVRVNCLIPGMTETAELVERFRLDDPASRARVLAGIPQGRIGTPEDMADALEFLVGCSFMTGQKLIVDGGEFPW